MLKILILPLILMVTYTTPLLAQTKICYKADSTKTGSGRVGEDIIEGVEPFNWQPTKKINMEVCFSAKKVEIGSLTSYKITKGTINPYDVTGNYHALDKNSKMCYLSIYRQIYNQQLFLSINYPGIDCINIVYYLKVVN